ncbi:tetratricopeptide repeat protein [Pseudomonas sp. NPDC007930]|uniref:tetratricopeptide repeat protein n=1 Tax=Pseudomonas sp. NPDC007930 TaxID=3364417 RepID=UPI0036EC19EF
MFQSFIVASIFCVVASAFAETVVAQGSTVMPEHSLDFTCQHEIFHTISTEVDSMFMYGRWLQRNNLLAGDGLVNRQVERFYRIAAEHGHSKASINLQNGVFRGEFSAQPGDSLRLSERLIEAEVASGYYFVGEMLSSGAGGLDQDSEMALRYFRKAADLGSAEAQFLIAEILSPRAIAPAVAAQMYLCAAQQGHGKSGVTLGVF